jgi:hypothetical protein
VGLHEPGRRRHHGGRHLRGDGARDDAAADRHAEGRALPPEKIATAFDAQPGATPEQCKDLAKAKLKQAVESVVSSLVKS